MKDLLSYIPEWSRGVIAIAVLVGGSNGAQYWGMGAPAQEAATMAEKGLTYCDVRLKDTEAKLDLAHEELKKCWRECGR